MIEEERKRSREPGDPERKVKALAETLAEVEVERRGYLRLAARGKMSDADLDEALAELEETRHVAEEELRKVEGRRERLEALKRDKDALLERYANTAPEALDSLTPEERHRVYGMLGLTATITPEGTLEVSGMLSGKESTLCGTQTRRTMP